MKKKLPLVGSLFARRHTYAGLLQLYIYLGPGKQTRHKLDTSFNCWILVLNWNDERSYNGWNEPPAVIEVSQSWLESFSADVLGNNHISIDKLL